MDLKLLAVLVIVAVLTVEFCDAASRRSGGGSRGGSKSSGSRRRSSSGSSSRRRSTAKRRSYSPAGTSRVTKYTYIPVRTSTSAVIVRQTSVGRRSNLGRNVFIGYMFYRYGLHRGPVYRTRYPLYRSEVAIPEERAIRVNFTKEMMLDSNGALCLNSSKNFTLAHDMNERVQEVLTEVRYDHLYGGVQTKKTFGDNQTVTIDKDSLGHSVEVSTLVTYNGTIVANTNCTQVRNTMNGTVVQLFATNPDASATITTNLAAVILSSVMYFLL